MKFTFKRTPPPLLPTTSVPLQPLASGPPGAAAPRADARPAAADLPPSLARRAAPPRRARPAGGTAVPAIAAPTPDWLARLDAAERGEMNHFVSAFPTTLADYVDALERDLARPVDAATIVDILNDVRSTRQPQVGESHAQAMGRVGGHQVDRFATRGLGLTDAEWARTQKVSRDKGRHLPWSTTIGSMFTYSAPTALRYGFGVTNPWFQALGSLAMAGVVQPAIATAAQTPIVAALDTRQRKLAHVMGTDGAVNAKRTPEQIARDHAAVQADLAQTEALVQHAWRESARTYGVAVPAAGELTADQVDQVVAALQEDADTARQADQRDRLAAAGEQHLHNKLRENALAGQLRMSGGMQDRMRATTEAQTWPRVLRAASPLVGLGVRVIGHAIGKNLGSPAAAASIVLAAGALAWQHLRAGTDELEGGMRYDMHLNLLYGSEFLTEAGRATLAAGEPLRPEHVDVPRVRQLAPGPSLQMLVQVGRQVAARAAASGLAPEKAAELAADLACLDDAATVPARLRDLAPGGDARRLLDEVMAGGADGHPWTFAAREAWQKIDPMELSVQGIKRVGAAWRGGLLGNVGVTAGPRLIVAAAGGTDHAHPAVQALAGLAGTAAGYHLATHQYEQDNIKNERRAAPESISAGQQLWNAVGDLRWQGRQQRASARVLADVRAPRAEDDLARQALALKPMPPDED